MGEHKLPKLKLLLALPNYGHERWNTLPIIRAMGGWNGFHQVTAEELCSSLLAKGFNTLWAHALAERKHGLTHFLMLHADIVPLDDGWLGQLHEEMVRVGAKILSAVSPMKDLRGLTSTALDGHPVRRLTMKEIMTQPETFTHPDLLVNTGMLLVDLREDWVESIYFKIWDGIRKDPDGSYAVVCEPEDWDFSRQARRLGVPLWVTRKVRLVHVGEWHFNNFEAWGTEAHDLESEARGRDMSPLITSESPASPRSRAVELHHGGG